MADLKDVLEQNKQQLGDLATTTDGFTKLSSKLNELGYDVLVNQREKAEYIPTSRLNEVISQRDTFKTQAEELNAKLLSMKDGAKGNSELEAKLQELLDQNQNLLTEIETTKMNTALMLAAKDAVNPDDVLLFVKKENLTVNKKGEILGLEAEINRVKSEKPYLFKTSQPNKGGSDTSGGDSSSTKFNMNSMIRRAAGR